MFGEKSAKCTAAHVFVFWVIEKFFEQKMKNLEGVIYAKFYSDNFIEVWFVHCKVKESEANLKVVYMGSGGGCHSISNIFTAFNRNVRVFAHTKLLVLSLTAKWEVFVVIICFYPFSQYTKK